MDPAQLIITAVITAAVTTLVTQAITGAIRAAGRRRDRGKQPAVLRRRGVHWTIANQTSSLMLEVNVNVTHPEFKGMPFVANPQPGTPSPPQEYTFESLSTVLPKSTGYLSGEIHAGDSVSLNWMTLTRIRQRQRYHSAEVNAKSDVDEYVLKVETAVGGYGDRG